VAIAVIMFALVVMVLEEKETLAREQIND
jgi:hypothetical protein